MEEKEVTEQTRDTAEVAPKGKRPEPPKDENGNPLPPPKGGRPPMPPKGERPEPPKDENGNPLPPPKGGRPPMPPKGARPPITEEETAEAAEAPAAEE